MPIGQEKTTKVVEGLDNDTIKDVHIGQIPGWQRDGARSSIVYADDSHELVWLDVGEVVQVRTALAAKRARDAAK